MDSAPNDILAHPHRPAGRVPVQLPKEVLLSLSALRPGRALLAVLEEWLIIAAAIAAGVLADHWLVTILAVLVVGARQHALGVLAHDAAHFRFLPDRRWNDWVGNLLLAWPVFISLAVFRDHHGPHHRFAGTLADGNRVIWKSHDAQGRLKAHWRYPASGAAFVLRVLRQTALLRGLSWMVGSTGILADFRGSRASVVRRFWLKILARSAFYAVAVAIIIVLGIQTEAVIYWLLPYCTWHIAANYIRVVCEHSGHVSDQADFALSRTTVPGLLGRIFVLPRHIGYHIEHHWYPSVPWYNLPALHAELKRDPAFHAHANVQTSVPASVRQCLAAQG